MLKKVCSNSPQGADLLTEKRAEDKEEEQEHTFVFNQTYGN